MRTTPSRKVRYSCHQRRLLSFLGALLYVLSAIALPSLHVGFHRDDHEHRGGGLKLLHGVLGAHPHQHLAAHSHSASSYREADDEHPAELQSTDARAAALAIGAAIASFAAPPRPLALATPFVCALHTTGLNAVAEHAPHGPPTGDPAHGDGSLVHFASAFLPSAAPATTPLAGPLLALIRFYSPVDRAPHSPVAATKTARGPPSPVAA